MNGQLATRSKITDLLDEWYLTLRSQNQTKSKIIRNELLSQWDVIEKDEKDFIHFLLLDCRYKLLVEDYSKINEQFYEIEQKRDHMDDLLLYYYCSFRGLYDYYLKKYDTAIKHYMMAESLLELIDDPIEHAEFYYRLGATYYHLDYLTFAIAHGQKSLDLLYSQKAYIETISFCKLLLGLAYTDLGKFDHAKFYLDEAKEEYKQHPQYYNDLREQGLNRNFGLLFSAKGDSEKAIDYGLTPVFWTKSLLI